MLGNHQKRATGPYDSNMTYSYFLPVGGAKSHKCCSSEVWQCKIIFLILRQLFKKGKFF